MDTDAWFIHNLEDIDILKVQMIVVVIVMTLSCKARRKADSSVKTDFGNIGNKEVATTFENYQRKQTHCNYSGYQDKRVMVTGFGLFFGSKYNISGLVTSSMASKEISQDSISTSEHSIANTADPTLLSQSDHGGVAVQRTLEIDGELFEFCFLTLDVRWDLAAAIVIFESNLFSPDFILMSGTGGDSEAHYEWGAINLTTSSPGFKSSGESDPSNLPLDSYILASANARVRDPILMTWDARRLARESDALSRQSQKRYRFIAETSASEANNYVCNNISFLVLHALAGYRVSIAGDSRGLYSIRRGVKAGFFHYPARTSPDSSEVAFWIRIIAKAALSTVQN